MTTTDYVIERASRHGDLVTIAFVIVPNLQRAHVTVKYADSSAETLGPIIDRTIAGLDRPTKPLR